MGGNDRREEQRIESRDRASAAAGGGAVPRCLLSSSQPSRSQREFECRSDGICIGALDPARVIPAHRKERGGPPTTHTNERTAGHQRHHHRAASSTISRSIETSIAPLRVV
jgi:hypothetical protein